MTTSAAGTDEAVRFRGRVWTIDAFRKLGATTDVETADATFGVSRSGPASWRSRTSFRCRCDLSRTRP